MENRLYFRALEYTDLEFVNFLRNDKHSYKYTCGNKYYTSLERDKKWIEDKIFNNNDQLYLMVCKKDDNSPIGYFGITNIDYKNRKARYGGIMIANQYASQGYGTETTKLIMKHVFCELGINLFYGFWREDHVSSLRMAKKCGFSENGLVKDFVYKQGKYHNAYLLSILSKEYFGK